MEGNILDKILNSWWSILDDPQLMILYIVAALLSAVAFYLMYKDGKKEKILMQEKELEKAKLELAKKEKQEKRK
jgi:flagellar biosynthesis/type III secretory pathway M-ring protein FliF/YscJ